MRGAIEVVGQQLDERLLDHLAREHHRGEDVALGLGVVGQALDRAKVGRTRLRPTVADDFHAASLCHSQLDYIGRDVQW